MSLKGKTALVTGGSRGIGRAVSERLAASGAYVFINYLANNEAAEEALKAIHEKGGGAELAPFDITDFNLAQKAVAGMIERRGSIDVLVNNAGISRDTLFVRMKEEDWDSVIATDLKGAFNCTRAVARQMMRKRWGRIINISSVIGLTGNAGQVNYSAAKAALIGFTKSLAREIGSRNICVNAIAPGWIETDMTSTLGAEEREQVIAQIPLARPGRPEDVAGLVLFLVSEDAAYITGQVISVNGGLYM